ncbi:MAG: hypothetical protein ABL949_09055 [Fimbriimonadaceae bacterium]
MKKLLFLALLTTIVLVGCGEKAADTKEGTTAGTGTTGTTGDAKAATPETTK